MRRQLIIGGLALASIGAGCGPPETQPVIGQPGYCGQTTDGSAVVAMVADATRCPARPGQKQILVAERCGPLMEGDAIIDDCYRGNVPGRLSPDVFRYGTITGTPGGVVIVFVASDATSS